MNTCLYLFHGRIIHWTPMTLFSKPVRVPKTTWCVSNTTPPIPLNDIVMRGNVGYNFQNGFYTIDEPLPKNWVEREGLVEQIKILGGLTTVANIHKSKYTDNSLGQPLADILLVDEIREYRRTGSMDNSLILQSLLETTEAGLSPEALVIKLELQYETFRTVIAYLNRLEFTVRELLKVGDFKTASDLLNDEIEKTKT